MKIRTKLLLTLGSIAIIPPVAAYIALIDNPRISLAIRMNEYEAQRGIAAGQLQSVFRAIGSNVEESLSETYRMQVNPGQHDDAERQRRFANSATQSGIVSFEKELDTITRLMAKQTQEMVAGGESLDAIDQREAELIEELHDALPDFKSTAEEFIQLSDKSSKTEGDFVQETFEPEVGEKLGRVAQELAELTVQGSEADRRKIEAALAHSYKESILVVFLGFGISGILGAVISRSVVDPIHKLRDAAVQIGRGKLDTKIVLNSKDELGELATSFNTMTTDLAELMQGRGLAQQELSQAHEKLKTSIGELETRNQEAAALGEMAELLQSCFTVEEASRVIESSAQKLFRGLSGSLLVFSASRNVLEAVTSWGPSSSTERIFSPNDCWALRRGRLHRSSTETGAVRCTHLMAESHLSCLCTPLMAHGETLGILCLVSEPNETTASALDESNIRLATSVAEQAGLAFANLRLREKLRHQSIRDPLTGLYNRRYLDESLEREIPNALRKKRSLGVIMLDVDKFKRFNDTFGHDAGDTVLRELGDYLAKFIRRGDLACRYGGEEFTLILPEASLEDTRRRAEELRTSFQQLSIKHRDIVLGKVTLSLGVAALPDHGTTAEEIVGAADAALFKAKESGRDRVLVAGASAGV